MVKLIMNRVKKIDNELYELLDAERKRQHSTITLIPSENYTYQEVMDVMGSVLTNKYSEGYPHKRYYNGNEYVDKIELLAIERAKKVFKSKFANVQPYSGSPANLAVYYALLKPGDKVMGLELSHGGHLTHGAKVSFSGTWFEQIPIYIESDGNIDYKKLENIALKQKPRMLIAGITAYPKELDYEKLSKIAKKINAYLVADISHTNGLVIAGIHQNPLAVGADIVTSTTHKMLRGPRGAVILTNSEELAKKIDKSIMPGLQGGPHNHQTAAIALTLKLADTQDFKKYVIQLKKNAEVLAYELNNAGFILVTGGTENHMVLLDLTNTDYLGKQAADLLEKAKIVVNANAIPNEPNSPLNPSGIRLGTPALTSRGMKEEDVKIIAKCIKRVILDKDSPIEVGKEITSLLDRYRV